MKPHLLTMGAILFLALVEVGCQASPTAAPTQTPRVIVLVVTPTNAPIPVTSPTRAIPTDTPAPPVLEPTATGGPQCTVQQQLNFRKGPGTDFNPPLASLPAGALLVPQGFDPQGFPAGAWVQALEPISNQIGWVSAGTQFITCNVDVTQLPQVAVGAPPPPPPQVSNSQVEGDPGDMQAKAVFSPLFLVQMQVRVQDTANDGDGVQQVVFTVEQNGAQVYTRAENTAKFCIFGGGEPDCNPWPNNQGVYTWGDGGPPVQKGEYAVRIEAVPNANYSDRQGGSWHFTLTVN